MKAGPQPSTAQRDHFINTDRGRAIGLVFCFPKDTARTAIEQAMAESLAGTLVHDLTCSQQLVGSGKLPWGAVQIYRYPDRDAALRHVTAVTSKIPVERVFAVSPAPLRVRIILAAFRRVYRFFPAPRRDATPEMERYRTDINPSLETLDALDKIPAHPVAMINLLRYKPRAEYDDGEDRGSGAAAYMRYGKVAMQTIFRLGGQLTWASRYVQTLAGADGNPEPDAWHELAVMQYPRPDAFLHMIHTRRYLAALAHRDAGLATTLLIASAPQQR